MKKILREIGYTTFRTGASDDNWIEILRECFFYRSISAINQWDKFPKVDNALAGEPNPFQMVIHSILGKTEF